MRYLLLAALMTLCAFRPVHAATFDYYLFSLSWSPEFCHDHPSAGSTPECKAGASMNFVVHGLWPSNNNNTDPSGCPATPFDPSAVPAAINGIMPADILQHEWEKHGVCSGMTENIYFQKIASLFQSLAIPVKNTGADLHIAPAALRVQFAQANAGTTSATFSIEDNGQYLTEVRSCWSRAFTAIACPQAGDTRNTPITIRAKP